MQTKFWGLVTTHRIGHIHIFCHNPVEHHNYRTETIFLSFLFDVSSQREARSSAKFWSVRMDIDRNLSILFLIDAGMIFINLVVNATSSCCCVFPAWYITYVSVSYPLTGFPRWLELSTSSCVVAITDKSWCYILSHIDYLNGSRYSLVWFTVWSRRGRRLPPKYP